MRGFIQRMTSRRLDLDQCIIAHRDIGEFHKTACVTHCISIACVSSISRGSGRDYGLCHEHRVAILHNQRVIIATLRSLIQAEDRARKRFLIFADLIVTVPRVVKFFG